LFIDLDGADNVFGYSAVGQGYDGGQDDNFQLARNSPAIDRGFGWTALSTDLDGNPRRDDTGRTNLGAVDYTESILANSQFAVTGTAQNWKGNGAFWSQTLPFAFPFYDATYTSVLVSSEGYLRLAGTIGSDGANSIAKLSANRLIAPLWQNLKTTGTGDDIFVTTSVAGQITIRWNATNEADNSDVQFAVTLFSDGRIRFDYGPGNTNLLPTVGLSYGNGLSYVLSSYNGQTSLTNARSIEFPLQPGIVDLGAYDFQGSSLDVTPPVVTGSTPGAVFDGSTISFIRPAQVILDFSEALNPLSARSRALYQLVSAGNDGSFGTADDQTVDIGSISYSAGTTLLALNLGAPLGEGLYRLTVLGGLGNALVDLSGNPLDGDANGTAGGNFARTFRVNDPPLVTLVTVNNGGTERSRITRLSVQFNEALSVAPDAAAFQLVNLTTGQTIPSSALAVNFDTTTSRARLTFPGLTGATLPDGRYELTVRANAIADIHGLSMAVDFAFDFHALAGDVNGDAITNDLDLFVVWKNSIRPPASQDLNNDLDGDGVVTSADVDIVKNNYLAALPPLSGAGLAQNGTATKQQDGAATSTVAVGGGSLPDSAATASSAGPAVSPVTLEPDSAGEAGTSAAAETAPEIVSPDVPSSDVAGLPPAAKPALSGDEDSGTHRDPVAANDARVPLTRNARGIPTANLPDVRSDDRFIGWLQPFRPSHSVSQDVNPDDLANGELRTGVTDGLRSIGGMANRLHLAGRQYATGRPFFWRFGR